MSNEDLDIELKTAVAIMQLCWFVWISLMFLDFYLFSIGHWSSWPTLIITLIFFAVGIAAGDDRRIILKKMGKESK